jgi:hypothetical protein
MRSFEQDFRHQKSAKTPVNKGQNDFLSQKSPTSFGEEPFFIIKAFFFVSSSRLSSSWLAFSGSAQVSMTWLNLLSVQPCGRTLYRFQDWPEKRTEPIL